MQEVFQSILVGTLVVSIMSGVGLDLPAKKLAEVVRRPWIILLGLLMNYVAIPAIAFGISSAMALATPVMLALVLVAATPGGPFGAMLTQRANADLAVSVSVLVAVTLLNTFLTPTVVGVVTAAGSSDLQVPLWPAMKLIVFLQLIPLAITVAIRTYKEGLAKKLQPVATWVTNIAFTILLVGMALFRGGTAADVGVMPIIAIQLLVMSTIAVGYFLCPLDRDSRVAFGLTNVIRSIGLALLLAETWFGEYEETSVLIMFYALMTFVNGIPFSIWAKRRKAKLAAVDARDESVAVA